jgi:hypothetical protein
MKRILAGALVPASVVGGLAVANNQDDSTQDRDDGRRKEVRMFHRGPHGPAPFLRNLTYGELHVRRDGKDVVVRIDAGKVKSADSDSLTITENNGEDVTIPVDDDTRVVARPFGKAKVSDLKEGRQVVVHRDQGEPAEVVLLVPNRARLMRGLRGARGRRFALPAPPPGARGRDLPPPPPGAWRHELPAPPDDEKD